MRLLPEGEWEAMIFFPMCLPLPFKHVEACMEPMTSTFPLLSVAQVDRPQLRQQCRHRERGEQGIDIEEQEKRAQEVGGSAGGECVVSDLNACVLLLAAQSKSHSHHFCGRSCWERQTSGCDLASSTSSTSASICSLILLVLCYSKRCSQRGLLLRGAVRLV